MSDNRSTTGKGIKASWMKAKPAKPGEIYGVPGQGESLKISVVVIAGLIFVWWLVTYAGYIKPLFLPSPMGVIDAFLVILRDGFTGASFWEHTWVSTLRVFSAFLLACIVGIPLGIAMAMRGFARPVGAGQRDANRGLDRTHARGHARAGGNACCPRLVSGEGFEPSTP